MKRLRIYILALTGIALSVSTFGQRSLVHNEAFAARLATEDLKALYAAQDDERRVADMLIRFYESYDAAAGIVAAYGKATGAAAADSLYRRFEAAGKEADARAQEMSAVWERAFDNKMFAYNYFLEVAGHRKVLAEMESASRDMLDEIARRRDTEESEEVLEYLEQKSLMFNYEHTLAKLLGADGAADSLARVKSVFDMLKRPLPRLKLEERSFIEYQPIKIYSPARYTAKNPIPQVAEYSNGLVYRVRLGSYTAKQAVSVFKGVWPLGLKQNGKMWDYYAGGYDDLVAAEKALADMKKHGFSKAVLVVWNDGVATVLGAGRFRVLIESKEIPEEVRSFGAAEIVRQGDGVFAVGLFASGIEAERVAAAVRKAEVRARIEQI